MECNKEEAFRAKEIAENKMEASDFVGAQKLVMKAQRLFPNLENITQLIAVCEVHCSAQNKTDDLENWYGILQVEQSADMATIKKQYRKLALLLHPDKNKFAGAEAAFKLIGEANRLLTDQTKRSQYDRDLSRAKQVPPQSNINAGNANNVPNNASNLKASTHVAFWTCCQFCGMRYKYLREYVNRVLRCQNCQKSFIAYDVGFEVVPPGSKPVQNSSQKEVPSQGPSRVSMQNSHVNSSGMQHVDKSKGVGQASKPGSAAEVGKTVRREEKLGEKDVGGGKKDGKILKPDAAKSQSEVEKPEPSAVKSPSEVTKTEPSTAMSQSEVNKPKRSAATSMPSVMRSKLDMAKTDEKATSRSRDRKKKRKVAEESSESFETSSYDDDEKDEAVKENVGSFAGQTSEESTKRRSSRQKRKVSYVENGSGDDFVSPPKKAKASRTSNSNGEMKLADSAGRLSENAKFGGSASCTDTCKKEVKQMATSAFEESLQDKDKGGEGRETNGEEAVISSHVGETSKVDSNISKSNENVTLEPEVINCPEPEFNDFDKDKTMGSFSVNQIWAIYDPTDGMPRFYARIRKVFKPSFKLTITWLEPRLAKQGEPNEIDEDGILVACGKFENGETEDTKDLLMFSHRMHHIRLKKYILLYPKKGETWALFRDWDISWSSDPEKHKPPYHYDFVEIISDFSEDIGIGVAYLGKVKGFVSLFVRAEQDGVIAFHILPEEIHRFSHKVPSFRMTGEEKEGIPADSLELDPAALPNNIFELCHTGDMKTEKQSLDSKANSSCPKAHETEVKTVSDSGTPKKRQKIDKDRGSSMFDKSAGEISNDTGKNHDHATPSLDEKGKGVTSKGSSTSCQVDEMKTSKKLEKGNRATEALSLRRSPRGLSEKDSQVSSQYTAQDTEKLNYCESHKISAQSDGDGRCDNKMNTPKKLEKDDSVTEALRLRRSPRGLNKTDDQPNSKRCATENTHKHSNLDRCENNHDFSSQSKVNASLTRSNGSNGVAKSSKPETCTSSSFRIGEEKSFDFNKEKSEDKFQVDQIWALYSTKDGMPEKYAQIKKIETTPNFRLHVALLEACSLPTYTARSVCCGVFKIKIAKTKVLTRSSFSHQLQAVPVAKNKYEVYPRKGEIWAIYKNIYSDSARSNPGECDIVEVLEDKGQIIKLVVLRCVNGFNSLYRVPRSQESKAGTIDLPRTEIARFSHQIPAVKHNRLRGCWELDSSAIPRITIILD